MGDKNKRPVYLNLFRIRLPVTGVVSILHRVSGVLLVLLLPGLIYILDLSLRDPGVFAACRAWLSRPFGRAATLLLTWLLVQHFYSGIRHLLLDLDLWIGRPQARATAWLTFVASILTVVVVGVLL